MAYTQAFEIPVNKDWVFRQGTKKDGTPGSQTELLENNPGVTRINVAHRSTARPTTAGYDVVKVTIHGANARVVKELFEEGRQKILASLAYDAQKAEKKRVHKQRKEDKRFYQKERELYEKHAPMEERHQQDRNASKMVQIAELAINKFEKGNSTTMAQKKADETATKRNGFGALEVEDVQAQANLRKMQRQAAPLPPSPQVTRKPALGGWAKMASKAPPVSKQTSETTINVTPIIARPAKKAPKAVETWSWNSVDEGQTTGWDANW